MYKQNDKVMLLETGEVFTVIMDLSGEMERGVVVRENIGRNLSQDEVRAAGKTRERLDAARGIVPPEPAPAVPYGAQFI
jgi:hypothetical protein